MKKAIAAICFVLVGCSSVPQENSTGPVPESWVAQLNALREQAGRAPLREDARLSRAARNHANDMARNGFFGHEGANGSDVGARVRATGYAWCGVAENIAQGHPDVASVLAAWMASPGHRRNMLNAGLSDVGLGQVPDRQWVMVLARPC